MTRQIDRGLLDLYKLRRMQLDLAIAALQQHDQQLRNVDEARAVIWAQIQSIQTASTAEPNGIIVPDRWLRQARYLAKLAADWNEQDQQFQLLTQQRESLLEATLTAHRDREIVEGAQHRRADEARQLGQRLEQAQQDERFIQGQRERRVIIC